MNTGDLNVALTMRLLDEFSSPARKVQTTLRNLKKETGEFRSGFSQAIRSGFSVENIDKAMQANEQRIAKSRGRLRGAFAMALSLGAPVFLAGNFQEQFIEFSNLANLTKEEAAALDAEPTKLSSKKYTGMSKVDLLEGISAYVGKRLSVDEALEALMPTGRAAKSQHAEFGDMANSGFAVMDNLQVSAKDVGKAFEIMTASGKEGSFELKAMARNFPELTAGAKALNMEGVEGVSSISAALQIAMKSAGSEDQAANNVSNFFGKLTSPDTVKRFEEFGVSIQEEMQKEAENGTDPLEHMLGVIQEITGGDAFKMGELFGDKQALDFLRAIIPNFEEYKRIKETSLNSTGVIDKDYQAVMDGFNESLRQLKNSTGNLFGASGALLPVFTDIIQRATVLVDNVAAWTHANPELTKTIVLATAGLLAFGITTRLVGYGMAVTRGGLLSLTNTFLHFNGAGKNVSKMGRFFRRLRIASRRSARSLGMTQRLLRGGLKFGGWAIKPLVWTGRLLPAIKWAALAGRLSWRMLVFPSNGARD